MASNLSRGDARIYAQRFIVSGIRNGMSGNEILNMLRSFSVDGVSLGYRTQTFFQDYNKYLNAKQLPRITTLASLPSDFDIQYAYPTPTRGGNRVMYVMELNGFDAATNEQMTQRVAIISPFEIAPQLLPYAFQSLDFETQYNMRVDWANSTVMQPKHFYSELP